MWYDAKREFIESAARVMWADAWANSQPARSFSGCELTEIAPPTPQYALYEAAVLLGKLEAANGASLAEILQRAGVADCADEGHSACDQRSTDCPPVDAGEFGSDIALQALGHGVSWFDDHAKFELTVPSIEFDYQA